MPLINKKEWILVKLIWILEKISFWAWWFFAISIVYGMFLCIVNYVNNPDIKIYMRLGAVSGFVFLVSLLLIFLLDDGKACIDFPESKE